MSEADALLRVAAALDGIHDILGWLTFWFAMAVLFKTWGGRK
jgi:hypothetical protein